MDTAEILAQITELREKIASLRKQQRFLWPDPDYAHADDMEQHREATRLGHVIQEREREIELLGLQVTTPTPQWPGGWLIGSTAATGTDAWIVPFDLRSTPDPVWRDRAAADAALDQLRSEDPPPLNRTRMPARFTPARPDSWMPPATDGDTGDYRVHWVAATRKHIEPGGLAYEVPLDLIGWQQFPPRPAPDTAPAPH